MSQNLISKYLFLEQKAQSLEEVLTFLTKAGGSIHIFSESTHIEALIKPCKMMKIKKKSYLYNPNRQAGSHCRHMPSECCMDPGAAQHSWQSGITWTYDDFLPASFATY